MHNKLIYILITISLLLNIYLAVKVTQKPKVVVKQPFTLDIYYQTKLLCSDSTCFPIEEHASNSLDCFNNEVCFRYYTRDTVIN